LLHGQVPDALNYMNSYSDIKDSLMTSEKQQQIMDFKNFQGLFRRISATGYGREKI
jgi:hypothetical protein